MLTLEILLFFASVATAQVCNPIVINQCSGATSSCTGSECNVYCSKLSLTQWPCASVLPRILNYLTLNNNLISLLPTDMFNGGVSFDEGWLTFQDNIITFIAPRAFGYVEGLKTLIIAGNLLSQLTTDMFNGLTIQRIEIEYMPLSTNDGDMYNNPITYIASGAFNNVTGLDRLVLSENYPNLLISPDAFNGVNSLYAIFLLWNFNMTLSATAFAGLPSLSDSSFYCQTVPQKCPVSACADACGIDNFCVPADGWWAPGAELICLLPTTTTTAISTPTVPSISNEVKCILLTYTSAICDSLTFDISSLQTISSPVITQELEHNFVLLLKFMNGGLPRIVAYGNHTCVLDNDETTAALYSFDTGLCKPLVSFSSTVEWKQVDKNELHILFSDSTTNHSVGLLIQCSGDKFAAFLSAKQEAPGSFSIKMQYCSACADGCL